MTSNGNLVQKALIKEFIKTYPDCGEIFKKVIKELENEEQRESVLRIAKKFKIKL